MEMLRFENQEYIYGLLLLPVFMLLYWWWNQWRKRTLRKYGDHRLVRGLIVGDPRSRPMVKFILLSLALFFLIPGMANLQLGTKMKNVKRKGVDLVVALDLSRSMLSEDVKPSRLEKAKYVVSQLLEQLANDRVALVIFARNAYLQMPLTVDYAAARIFLKSVDPGIVPSQGTAIGEAIRLAMESFKKGKEKYRTLLILSDGENHQGDALEAAKEASRKGVVINTIGTGTLQGAPIPKSRDRRGVDFVRNDQGEIVVSKMNEKMLQQIAREGNGKYFNISGNGNLVGEILGELEKMEKREYESLQYSDFEDKYQYFLGVAIFFLFLEFLLPERGSRRLNRQ